MLMCFLCGATGDQGPGFGAVPEGAGYGVFLHHASVRVLEGG